VIIDCQSCTMKDVACSDCVVTLLLGPVNLGADHGVLGVLADAGLVPPLRLVSNNTSVTHSQVQATGTDGHVVSKPDPKH
jgi:hypothetical protein